MLPDWNILLSTSNTNNIFQENFQAQNKIKNIDRFSTHII